MLKNHTRSRNEQFMAELAIGLPVLALTLIAIMYFGRLFYLKQTVSFAAQEAATAAARIPNLGNETVRNRVRGFNMSGEAVEPSSVVYRTLANANLLSQGNSGDLPEGASVRILPWDVSSADEDEIDGVVEVRIEYPFSLLNNNSNPSSEENTVRVALGAEPCNAVAFSGFTIKEQASAVSLVVQQ